jgi:uncharacterized protein (DUF433 family)
MKVPLVITDPKVSHGKPVVAGTHIAVTDILGWLASGRNFRQITTDHPELTEEAVKGAIRYCALITEAQTDPVVLQAASEALWAMGYGWDTEDLPPGPPAPPDMRIPTGYMGRVKGK